jgi:hypothetical protein
VFIAHFRELSCIVHHNMDFLKGGWAVFPWFMDGDEGRFDSRNSSLYHQHIDTGLIKDAREDRYLQITLIFLFPFLQEGIIEYPTRVFLDIRLQSAFLVLDHFLNRLCILWI